MNYYNPYMMSYPYQALTSSPGLFSRLASAGKGGISLSSIISGTGRTLNTINQAIPLIKQAKPLMNNAKTMFRVMNEFKKVDTPTSKKSVRQETGIKKETKKEDALISSSSTTNKTTGPTFFL